MVICIPNDQDLWFTWRWADFLAWQINEHSSLKNTLFLNIKLNPVPTPQVCKVAGLSWPGVSKVDWKIWSRRENKNRSWGIQTHICIISGFQTQGTKPLGHQNCKWPSGKTSELKNGCFVNLLVETSGVLTLKLSMDAAHHITLHRTMCQYWDNWLIYWEYTDYFTNMSQ